MEGSDSRIFLSDLTDADIVNITLIIMNKVAVKAVNLDNKLAEPLADIIPPIPPPPPSPKPSLSEPWSRTKITNNIAAGDVGGGIKIIGMADIQVVNPKISQ